MAVSDCTDSHSNYRYLSSTYVNPSTLLTMPVRFLIRVKIRPANRRVTSLRWCSNPCLCISLLQIILRKLSLYHCGTEISDDLFGTETKYHLCIVQLRLGFQLERKLSVIVYNVFASKISGIVQPQ